MKLLFLGTCACLPAARQDSSSYLLDEEILIDTGWNATQDMLNYGANPCKVNYLFITHCHQDHYLGMPQLLFYQAFAKRSELTSEPLTIVGPIPEIKMIFERAKHFLCCDCYDDIVINAKVMPISPGMCFDTAKYSVTTCPTIHPAIGICYRVTEKSTGKSVVFSGDTAFLPSLAMHAEGADLLVHEATCAGSSRGTNIPGGHSGAPDAANIASMAHVRQLALVHYTPSLKEEAAAAAQGIFPNTITPMAGDTVSI